MAEVSLQDQIKCVDREIKMRRQVYPKWVERGTKTREWMEKEIASMEAVAVTLREVERSLSLFPEAPR